jgi:hypothetical protein
MGKVASIAGLELLLFAAVLLMMEAGYWAATRSDRRHVAGGSAARQAVTGTVQALMGLILAFSFSDAAARLALHRRSVVDETNAIATAWHRLDLLAPPDQARLRELFRRYLDARIQAYAALPALNLMSDVAQQRTLAVRTHMSSLAGAFMFGLILAGSLLVGTSLAGRRGRSWMYRIIYAAVVASAVHVILDMEYPRNGVIRTRDADLFMDQLRQEMG